MRVLRAGGRYLEGREQRLWTGLIAVGAIGLGGSVLVILNPTTSRFPQWTAIVAIIAATMSAGMKVARRLTSVRKGRLGERLVTHRLHSLSDEYWLVNDVVLPRGRGNVDHVLIGPCGVVVIETKRLAGRIRCDGDEWFVNGWRRESISRQVNSGASAVRCYLAECHPDLVPTALRWIESIVVFTHPTCRFEVNRARTTVVRYSSVLEVVLELARKHHLVPSDASRLAASLAASQASEPVRGSP